MNFSETTVGVDESVQQLRSVVTELLTVTYQILGSNPNSPQTIPAQLQQLIMGPQHGNINQGNQLLLQDSRSPSVPVPILVPSMSVATSSSFHAGAGDSVSIRTAATARSIVSMQSVRSISNGFIETLNNSRVYKLVHRRRPVPSSSSSNSDTSSVFSVSTDSTRLGRWSALSDLSLGDLSISEISVMQLPLFMSDIWDPWPYQLEQSQAPPTSTAKKSRRTLKLNVISSSWGQIHSAIEVNNELVIRALLRLGTDIINELNLKGWTPLLHAAFRCRESICGLLLENGAGLGGPTRPGAMELTSIKTGIERAIKSPEDHVMTLQILLLQAIMKTEESGYLNL